MSTYNLLKKSSNSQKEKTDKETRKLWSSVYPMIITCGICTFFVLSSIIAAAIWHAYFIKDMNSHDRSNQHEYKVIHDVLVHTPTGKSGEITPFIGFNPPPRQSTRDEMKDRIDEETVEDMLRRYNDYLRGNGENESTSTLATTPEPSNNDDTQDMVESEEEIQTTTPNMDNIEDMMDGKKRKRRSTDELSRRKYYDCSGTTIDQLEHARHPIQCQYPKRGGISTQDTKVSIYRRSIQPWTTPACKCTTIRYTRQCYMSFFGSKDEIQTHEIIQASDSVCMSNCPEVMRTKRDKIVGNIGDYPCKWLSTNYKSFDVMTIQYENVTADDETHTVSAGVTFKSPCTINSTFCSGVGMVITGFRFSEATHCMWERSRSMDCLLISYINGYTFSCPRDSMYFEVLFQNPGYTTCHGDQVYVTNSGYLIGTSAHGNLNLTLKVGEIHDAFQKDFTAAELQYESHQLSEWTGIEHEQFILNRCLEDNNQINIANLYADSDPRRSAQIHLNRLDVTGEVKGGLIRYGLCKTHTNIEFLSLQNDTSCYLRWPVLVEMNDTHKVKMHLDQDGHTLWRRNMLKDCPRIKSWVMETKEGFIDMYHPTKIIEKPKRRVLIANQLPPIMFKDKPMYTLEETMEFVRNRDMSQAAVKNLGDFENALSTDSAGNLVFNPRAAPSKIGGEGSIGNPATAIGKFFHGITSILNVSTLLHNFVMIGVMGYVLYILFKICKARRKKMKTVKRERKARDVNTPVILEMSDLKETKAQQSRKRQKMNGESNFVV